jgi:hypothetical protein
MLELALLPRKREKVAPHAVRRAVTDEGAVSITPTTVQDQAQATGSAAR